MAKATRLAKDDAKGWRNEAKKLRKHLVDLTNANLSFLAHLDALMKQPSTVERGRAIAKALNFLEMANDGARYFGLGINYKTDKKLPTK